ncbi:MAG TPA: hypothetical protein HA315_04505 [Candidatus Thalassarchaeaceae archaeon]|nr:MAG TPA: hypothetical protein D7H72_04490 [Candidatus Poseidoniales archaeon]HII35242.1 hypothetical protein [Candidatus Thalassarchaeaceae archaeon]
MSRSDAPTHDELSSMKVDELREKCSELGLMVSGKKSELIQRVLDQYDPRDAQITDYDAPSKVVEKDTDGQVGDAVDRLLARFEGGEDVAEADIVESPVKEAVVSNDELPEGAPEIPEEGLPDGWTIQQWAHYGSEWLERGGGKDVPVPAPEEDEIMVADIVEEPRTTESEDDDTWKIPEQGQSTAPMANAQDSSSMVIVLPSFDSLFENWKPISAVIVAVMIAGGGAFYILGADSSFQARQLKYGDEMTFTIDDGMISITGDEMISLARDAASPSALDEICDEISVEIVSGSGSSVMRKGSLSDLQNPGDLSFVGAVSSPDAYGRDNLAAEHTLDYDLDMDLTFRRVTSSGECGGRVSLPDNTADITSKKWVEITSKKGIRSDLQVDFTDNNQQTSAVKAIIYDLEELSGISGISPLLLPLTPVELHEVFGDMVLTEGSSWADDPTWNSEWRWTVGSEKRTDDFGHVYEVEMWNQDVQDCLGYARLNLLVKSGSPWPVQQTVDLRLDKSLETGNCGLIAGTAAMSLPEGRVEIRMTMSELTSSSGSKDIEWYSTYDSRPGPGQDKPSSSSLRQWISAMPDESESRDFNLEEAIQCTLENHPSSGVANALESTGYIWQAYWSQPTRSPEWNMSWVTENDASGWTTMRQSGDSCDLIEDNQYGSGTTSWDRESVPDTYTMSLLEGRLLDDLRYSDLNILIEGSQGTWFTDVELGYLVTAPQDDLISSLPGGLGDGRVALLGERSWTDGSSVDNSLRFAMDAETSRMAGWVLTSSSSD